ncbi:MAG: hypothetical protein HeimC3_45570 [Candidatus Heimdallarchaeota archaeon LC_3]|nr:MAG: hypothetical protein HeimC3_45570 [Candidatus Heimdallarchaeota archaeon LC_3]
MSNDNVPSQNENEKNLLVKKTDTCYNISIHFKERPRLDKLNKQLIEDLIQNIKQND